MAEKKGFLSFLQSCDPCLVEEAYPLHNQDSIKDLSQMLKSSFIPLKGLNVDKIRNYFGTVVLTSSEAVIASATQPCRDCTWV